MTRPNKESSSFRDPSSFIYYHNGEIYRQINLSYAPNYDLLMNSGLYQKLVDEQLLIPHTEISETNFQTELVYKTIKPEIIPFITYAYEWSFNQLKDAALITLKIQQIAQEYGMSLKDASVYNIQFYQGKMIFIDTTSFEIKNDKPWVAYRQFCQHFLAPLLLMRYVDLRLNSLLRIYLDGIPLDLTSKLLPVRTYLNLNTLINIHLHAKSQNYYANKPLQNKNVSMSSTNSQGILQSLISIISSLKIPKQKTEWGKYYNNTNYSELAIKSKHSIIKEMIIKVSPRIIWDIGGNNGEFSNNQSNSVEYIINSDIDPNAINQSYDEIKAKNITNIIPILSDFSKPTPAIGWNNNERKSLFERITNVDLVMALALIHHLAISNNLPFSNITEVFSQIAPYLIIEFVPKEDSKVQILLQSREDIFSEYDQPHFEESFLNRYEIMETQPITDSKRILYLMKRR